MADSQLQSALAHWAPRLIANGIPLTDFQDVTGALASWNDWCKAWVARGDVHFGCFYPGGPHVCAY